jgi:hypothetical protein
MAYGRFEAMCKNHHKRKLQNLSGGDDLKEPNALAVSEVAWNGIIASLVVDGLDCSTHMVDGLSGEDADFHTAVSV